jgi:hypothetical protein
MEPQPNDYQTRSKHLEIRDSSCHFVAVWKNEGSFSLGFAILKKQKH